MSSAPPQEPGPAPSQTAAPAGAVRVVPVRHYGPLGRRGHRCGPAVALVLGLARAKIDVLGSIPDYLHNHLILVGLRNTIIISVLAQAIGIALGVVFAVMRLSQNPVVSSVSWFYIWFFRGTPGAGATGHLVQPVARFLHDFDPDPVHRSFTCCTRA